MAVAFKSSYECDRMVVGVNKTDSVL